MKLDKNYFCVAANEINNNISSKEFNLPEYLAQIARDAFMAGAEAQIIECVNKAVEYIDKQVYHKGDIFLCPSGSQLFAAIQSATVEFPEVKE